MLALTVVLMSGCTGNESVKSDSSSGAGKQTAVAVSESSTAAKMSHSIGGTKFSFALPAEFEKFPLKNTDTMYFDTGISGSEFSVMGTSQNCSPEFNREQIRSIIEGKELEDVTEETVTLGGYEVVKTTAKGKYGLYLSECTFFDNGDLLWVTADVPEEKADEIFAAAEGVFESLEHNGTPVRTESESYECSFFECEIPPKLAKGYAVGETLETGCYLCSDRNEQSCKLTVKAVLDGKDAAAHADETMSAENEKGSCERDTADFYGQQSHHLISRREADPNVKFVSNTSAEYWYFDNGSSVIEIKLETPEGMEQAFFDKVKPLLDSLKFKQ